MLLHLRVNCRSLDHVSRLQMLFRNRKVSRHSRFLLDFFGTASSVLEEKMALKVFFDSFSQPCRAVLMLLKANSIPFEGQVINIAKGKLCEKSTSSSVQLEAPSIPRICSPIWDVFVTSTAYFIESPLILRHESLEKP